MGKELTHSITALSQAISCQKTFSSSSRVTDIEEEHTGQLDQTGTEIVILRISLDELDNREQRWSLTSGRTDLPKAAT